MRRRLVEVLVEAERQPGPRCPGDRPGQREVVAEGERELRALDGRLDRELGDLTVALSGVAVARRQQRAVDGDRKVERRPGDELLAVDVPSARAWRRGRVDTRLVRRHADDAEKRTQRNLPSGPVATHPRVGIELPADDRRLAVVDAEPLVQRRVPAACVRDAPRPDPDLVDPDLERLTGAGTSHFDGADERVARVALVTLRRAQLEALAGRIAPARR